MSSKKEVSKLLKQCKELGSRSMMIELEEASDKLLALAPGHAKGLAFKGFALFRQDQLSMAKIVLDQAMKAAKVPIVTSHAHRFDTRHNILHHRSSNLGARFGCNSGSRR